MILITCGGGGGGGSSGPTADLTGLSVNGPLSMSEYGNATYTATASWSDNTTSSVAPTWSENSQTATISPGGVLYCPSIASDQAVTVSATYSYGGVTETDAMDVTVTNITTIPFTAQMVSGEVFFEENFYAGGDMIPTSPYLMPISLSRITLTRTRLIRAITIPGPGASMRPGI